MTESAFRDECDAPPNNFMPPRGRRDDWVQPGPATEVSVDRSAFRDDYGAGRRRCRAPAAAHPTGTTSAAEAAHDPRKHFFCRDRALLRLPSPAQRDLLA